jgi:hypothetical protein
VILVPALQLPLPEPAVPSSLALLTVQFVMNSPTAADAMNHFQ